MTGTFLNDFGVKKSCVPLLVDLFVCMMLLVFMEENVRYVHSLVAFTVFVFVVEYTTGTPLCCHQFTENTLTDKNTVIRKSLTV